MRVMMDLELEFENVLEMGYGIVVGVGEHTGFHSDGICSELWFVNIPEMMGKSCVPLQSRIGDSTLELVWKASASLCEMVEEALISMEGWGSSPVASIRSPSSTEMVSSSGSVSSESSESWLITGMGPVEQTSILLASAFLIILSWQSLSQHPEQQRGGHLDILTSPLTQSISGLWFRSHECPSKIFASRDK